MTVVIALCVLALVAIPFVLHALDLFADYGDDEDTLADIPDGPFTITVYNQPEDWGGPL